MEDVKCIVYRGGREYCPMQEIIPIEDVAEYMRLYYPRILNSLTTEEICAIDRGNNIERSVEIIEDYDLIESIANHISDDLREKHEIYVVENEISIEEEQLIIDFYCLP